MTPEQISRSIAGSFATGRLIIEPELATYTVATEWKSPGDGGIMKLRRSVLSFDALNGSEAIQMAERFIREVVAYYRVEDMHSTVRAS